MRSRRSTGSQVPEVNLVPMMDVLMSVLTFFIIISMSLTGQSIINVDVPLLGEGADVKEKKEPRKFYIGLDRQGQVILDNQPSTVDQMAEAMVQFLDDNPDGIVILKADQQLKYDRVVQLLEVMRDIGGDRVSLSVERES